MFTLTQEAYTVLRVAFQSEQCDGWIIIARHDNAIHRVRIVIERQHFDFLYG